MLAVAKKPRIKVSAEVIPESLLDFLRKNFGGVEINPETYTPDEIPELVEARENTSPGEAIFLDRDMRGMTQAQLAKKLGVAVTVVSDMENNRRAVSRKMAVKLADVFGSDPAAYFRFK
ncbi:helix-turn-helix transcriptional regulator [Hallerella succinigenes]|uniref:Helix-turn-helix protein n=1 Tax=Hallerella succinigenes TaxID=1896222 RepID=A0A2M9A9W9_9BACT|nr:helix-turn-helix transcriptional regulator [Hallerella succinigenes]PJJ42413.1 helix-turn-helix protein [Hallerella succinigenes]